MPSVISGDANVSATEFGYLDGVTSGLQSQIDAKLNLAGGKILQIVRATDSTDRTTSSTTFVDASISVTITPQKNDSAILLAYFAIASIAWTTDTNNLANVRITDASNNPISGAEQSFFGTVNITGSGTREFIVPMNLVAYATPATTSATTYKVQFQNQTASTSMGLQNGQRTGQLYAIEVSA